MEKEYLAEAIKEAVINEENDFSDGGPFGAIVVKDNEIIAKAHNTVISSKDPTAHAEVNAIRKAALKLGTHDLSDCQLYINAEPCPMCLSAIIWANIKEVYYSSSAEEAGNIGFRDDFIYKYIKSEEKDKNILKMQQYKSEEAENLFKRFKNNPNKKMY